MTLPVLTTPTYEVQLLSQEKPVKFRPFLVKEHKLLLLANESKEAKTTVNTIKQIIESCLIDQLVVDDLPLVDLETLFLHLKARSSGEISNLYFKCENEITTSPPKNPDEDIKTKCGMVLQVPIDLLKIPVTNKDIDKKILFDQQIGVVMKYPSFDIMNKLTTKLDGDVEYMVIGSCIDYIFDANSIYKAKDADEKELLDFIMKLPESKYDLMKNFIENSPRCKLTVEKECPKCKFKHTMNLEGLEDFFL